jgi:5-methylcytosine-specific restriction endonuclease McrA
MNESTHIEALPLKRCTKCREEKALTEFSRRASAKDGLAYRCKKCAGDYDTVYSSAHREERRVYAAAYYAAHPEEILAYRVEHREEIAAYNVAYRAEHREEGAAYQAEHLEERAAHNHNYRARKKGNGGTHTAADIQAQYARQKGRCFYNRDHKLGKSYHVDHVVPSALGGYNGPSNLVLACGPCNLSKGAKHPMDYAGVMF